MNIQIITSIVIVSILIIAIIMYIAWQIKKQGLKNFASELIVRAEQEFNKGENDKKLDFVVKGLTAIIPAPFSLFVTKKMVKTMVQNVFDMIKKALDYVPENKEEEV